LQNKQQHMQFSKNIITTAFVFRVRGSLNLYAFSGLRMIHVSVDTYWCVKVVTMCILYMNVSLIIQNKELHTLCLSYLTTQKIIKHKYKTLTSNCWFPCITGLYNSIIIDRWTSKCNWRRQVIWCVKCPVCS
jgi:hypothetical protein